MIMQFKLFLLLIGLCVISCHQATAENEEGMVYASLGAMNLRLCNAELLEATRNLGYLSQIIAREI